MNEEKIIAKLLEHDAKFEQMVTKEEFNAFKNQMLTSQDEILVILRRIDTERISTRAGMERMQEEIDSQGEVVADHEQRIQSLELKV